MRATANHEAAHPRGLGTGDIPSLTSLRGLLALWVVFYHFWDDVALLFPWTQAVSPLVRFGHMAVPAFFLLSGFVLSYNYGDRFHRLRRGQVARFLLMRLARIYPVHVITLFAVLAMVFVSRRLGYQLTDEGYTARYFLLNLLLMHTWVPDFSLNWNYPSWSISSEWSAYLLFPTAACFGLRRLTTPLRAAVVGTISVVVAVVVILWWRPWPFYQLVLVVPTFLAGAAAYWFLRGRLDAGSPAAWRWVPEVLVIAAVASPFVASYRVVVASLLACSLALITVLARLGNHCGGIWAAPVLVFLGEVSYSLYMTHTLVLKVVYRLLPSARFETADPFTRLAILAVYSVLIMAVCLGTYYLVERPCRMFFKGLVPRTTWPGQALHPPPAQGGGAGGLDRWPLLHAHPAETTSPGTARRPD